MPSQQRDDDSRRLQEDYFRTPSSARVWDYWLGGKDHYPVDKEAGDAFIKAYPEIREVARQSRLFLVRVVRYLAAEAGIRQFLDIGAGLPTSQNTHEVAQAVAPDSTIVYVDNDPVVLAHARALLTSNPEGRTDYIDADIHDTDRVLAEAATILDFDQPVALLLLGILGHAAATAEQMHTITSRLLAPLAPGSYLVIGDGVDAGDERYREAAARRGYHPRTPDEFRACFDGLELVEPGVVPRNLWRPEPFVTGRPGEPVTSYAGVGRKPAR